MITAANFKPEKLSLEKPEKKTQDKISFVVLPLRYESKPVQVKIQAGLKIFKHESKEKVTFSLGVTSTDDSLEFLSSLEKTIRTLAATSSKEIKKIDPRKVLHLDELLVLKTDKRKKQKVFAKLYSQKGKIQAPFLSVERDESGERKTLEPESLVGLPLSGMVVLHFFRVFAGTISSVTISAKEVFVKEIIQPKSLLDEWEENVEASETPKTWRECHDCRSSFSTPEGCTCDDEINGEANK